MYVYVQFVLMYLSLLKVPCLPYSTLSSPEHSGPWKYKNSVYTATSVVHLVPLSVSVYDNFLCLTWMTSFAILNDVIVYLCLAYKRIRIRTGLQRL